MELFDVLLQIDRARTLRLILWNNRQMEQMYRTLWESYEGSRLDDIFREEADRGSGLLLYWRDECFRCSRLAGKNGETLYLKKVNYREYLLEAALDKIMDGVQIYDKDACMLYLNSISRKISDIPENIQVEGRHLLDLYDLNESISTVITSLRSKAPVVNRFDNFQSSSGASIASTNTAYPIFRRGELVGSVVFEQNISVVEEQLHRLEEIRKAMREESGRLQPSKFAGYVFSDIIGKGRALTEAVELAKRVAAGGSSVMLIGETGTGKEVFAQSIHKASPRSGKKFVPVNCAAVPETLAESFFFGTQKGSYTGSVDRAGLLEEANGGTLFLDELNSMSLTMQSKLLRVIQEGTFRRVGGEKDIEVDVRFLSSCNEPPRLLLADNTIRKDLFYRLSTVMIDLPALREHSEDIDELVNFYIEQKSHHFAKQVVAVSPEAMGILKRFSWPGNVRELFHALDYVLNVVDCATVLPEHLPQYIRKQPEGTERLSPEQAEHPDWYRSDLQTIMDEYERAVLRKVLEHHGYNITRTAEALGIRRQSLQYRINKFGIVI